MDIPGQLYRGGLPPGDPGTQVVQRTSRYDDSSPGSWRFLLELLHLPGQREKKKGKERDSGGQGPGLKVAHIVSSHVALSRIRTRPQLDEGD